MDKTTKTIIIAIVLTGAAWGAYLLYKQISAKPLRVGPLSVSIVPSTSTNPASPAKPSAKTPAVMPPPVVNPLREMTSQDMESLRIKKVLVYYGANGFSTSSITFKIPVGAAVEFFNKSNEDMWVASNPHPTHSSYPTTGGCIASTFDSCRGIPPGGSWSFVFDVAGTWGYHNHLNPGHKGTVVVR